MNDHAGRGFSIRILSMPGWEGGLESDLHRVKAGILYGDQVSISSVPLATTYYAARIASGNLSEREVLEETLHAARMLDESAFPSGGKDEMVLGVEAMISALEAAERSGDQDALEDIRARTDAMKQMQLQEITDTTALNAALEIVSAESRGLAVVRRMEGVSGRSEQEVMVSSLSWWKTEIGDALSDPHAVVFADQTAMDLISESGDTIRSTDATDSTLRAARVADELFQRLPLLPNASLGELEDIRSSLSAPLTRFRAEMLRVGSEMEGEPFSDDLTREVNAYVVEKVEPSVLEIEEAFTVDRYLREVRERAEGVGKYLMPGGALGVALVGGNIPQALALGGVAALGIGVDAGIRLLGAQSEARKSGLFFYQRLARDYRF